MSPAVRWSLAPSAISAEMILRRSSGSCSAILQGPVPIAKCEPEAGFQLVGLGEEH